MGADTAGAIDAGLARLSVQENSGEDQMSKALRIVSVEPVIHGVLKIAWTDGYEGVVDLRPMIALGGIFSHLAKPKAFAKVLLEEYGHWIYWINEKGEDIDLGADALRETAEKQTRIHELMAV